MNKIKGYSCINNNKYNMCGLKYMLVMIFNQSIF